MSNQYNLLKVEALAPILTEMDTKVQAAESSADKAELFDGPKFDTFALASAYTGFTSGQRFVIWEGFNGEPETFQWVADSTLTIDGALVLTSEMPTGRLISTRTVFGTVAAMLADVRVLAVGTSLQADGFNYTVAADAATDHHLTTAGGVKLYVLPRERGYNVRAFGATGDNVTNDSAAIMKALSVGANVYFPTGTYFVTGGNFLELTRNIAVTADRDATLRLDTGAKVKINNPVVRTTTLAADVDWDEQTIQVADATDVQMHDLIHIDTATRVESGWGYDKQCIRRVQSISGNMVTLDQPLDFFFTVAEATRVDFARPFGVSFNGLNLLTGGSNANVNFLRCVNGGWKNALLEGPGAGWISIWSDVVYTVACDRMTYDNVIFRKSRYMPQIMQGSRYTTVRNFVADQVRHLDCNTWPQDTLFENGVGYSTDGIIQTHPAIRTTFRNVRDSVTQTGLFGLDLRGVGEVVEDCYATSSQGVGTNTNTALIVPDYRPWANRYTRTLRRFRSPTAGIDCGYHKRFEAFDCHVPGYNMNGYPSSEIFIDDRSTGLLNIGKYNFRQVPYAVDIPPIASYARTASPTAITDITQANPGVVSSPAHGLSNGDYLRITNPVGMGEVDYQYFKAANVTTDTFEINTVGDVAVDTTGYTAYTSGGYVAKHTPALKAERRTAGVARFPKAHFRIPQLISEGGGTGPVTVMISTETGVRQVLQKNRYGKMTVRARGGGLTEDVFQYGYKVFIGEAPTITKIAELSMAGGRTITLSNIRAHFHNEIVEEGAESFFTKAEDSYYSFDLSVSEGLDDLEIEIEEWVNPSEVY